MEKVKSDGYTAVKPTRNTTVDTSIISGGQMIQRVYSMVIEVSVSTAEPHPRMFTGGHIFKLSALPGRSRTRTARFLPSGVYSTQAQYREAEAPNKSSDRVTSRVPRPSLCSRKRRAPCKNGTSQEVNSDGVIMPSCVVRGCIYKWKKGDRAVMLHGFPKEPEKIKLWLYQTGQYGTDLDKMVEKVYLGKVYDTYRMCSLHFSNDSYYYDRDRKLLRKDAVPTIFITKTPGVIQKTFSSGKIRTRWIPVPVPSKPSSETTIRQVTLIPLFHQPCRTSEQSNSNSSSSLTVQPSATTTREDTKKPSSSVLSNSNLPLNTQLRPEATCSSTKTLSSTTTACPVISLSSTSTGKNCASRSDSSNKTQTAPPISIPLSVVSATQPCSMTVLPVSGTVSSVTQKPPTTSGLLQKKNSLSVVHIPLKTSTSQSVIPGGQPPSKKRKLEENIVFLEHSAASSSVPSVLPSHCMSQTSNTGNLYFISSSTPLVQPSYQIQKPLMVDIGVNTDYFINKKSCSVATDPMRLKRNVHTQTKIYIKHRKIMCKLIPPRGPLNDSGTNSTESLANPEYMGVSDCSPSRSSDCGDDISEVLKTVDLDVVKVEISSECEIDVHQRPTSEIHIKEENDSSAGQAILSSGAFNSTCTLPHFDINTMKLEPNIKTEEDQFPISCSIPNITNFVPQNPKIERTSPIPSDPFAPGLRNPTSWETSAIQTDGLEDLNDSSFYINEMSEDEDESFLLPSDAEDEDDIKPVFQDLDSPVENHVEEEKYIVFESCLKKLIMMIPCRSETKCMSPLTQYRKETIGSYLSIEVRCRSGHTSLLWESQPRHGYQPMGNVLLSAAVLFSGSSFLKSQHMFKLLNLKSIDKSTYYKTQSMYLFPTINHHWKEEQKAVIQSIQERPLCLAGDQQLDNPGFSARYSIYSMMDVASKKICSFSVQPVIPQVTLEGLEKIGFQKSMGELQTMNAEVEMIVTDRSVAIQELLKNNYPGIIHQLDLWHLSKSIGNEVLMAAKHKDCEILYEWVEAIRNHIWWSSCTCCKNPDVLIEKWKSVLQHVTIVHEWSGDSDCKACHHPPLPEEVVNSANWLEKDSAAHEQLKKIVENTSLLKDLKRLSFLCHTGELEIYHTTCLKYRPKTLHFFLDSMVARTQLAALDHNRNVCRVKELVKNASSGNALNTMTQGLDISKGQKSWIIKTLYKPTCQHFLFDIMNDVIALVREEKAF
ncbi:uncharacterized protein LOC120980037 [Bufo bufo]|uniref:uncharacterized protein LOC120980037 n=1 Tax=Bufo bufo TaxID=8384 RepID=UPI001ABE9AB3|nr:uncharacterized protein LOC120980037 [Bufo bufo]